MPYLLDADVMIRAKNQHYGMDFCPAFWEWLRRENEAGKVFSIEKVGDEIEAGGDELSTWAAESGVAFFLQPDEATLASFEAVVDWVSNHEYEPAAVSSFLHAADYYLVSQAHAKGWTVVTQEVPSNSKRKIKIPDVCIGLRIKCVKPHEMLRSERARFVLGAQE